MGGAAKLLKAAVGIDYDDEKDLDDLEAAMEDTLDCGNMDVDDIGAQQQAMDEYNKDAIQLDFNNMEVDELRDHVEETWAGIEEMKEEQQVLKESQENVVGHLVETNEWLFSALQETLTSQTPSTATAALSSRKLPGF